MKFIRRLIGRRGIEEQMREEMAFHLEERITDLVNRGMSREHATRTARLEFGNPEAHSEECRAALGYRLWDELRSDLRFAVRALRHQPGYSATAIAILAIAIGVNSAFFMLFSHHVLKPLPIRGADRHFDLKGVNRQMQPTGGWIPAEIDVLRQASREQVEDLYTCRTIQVLVLEPSQRLSLVSLVSGNYFRLLGGQASAGRTLTEADASNAVAVLSHSGQRRHFPDDPVPIGKRLRVRGAVLTIVGVMPPVFTGTESVVPDFWVGSEMQAEVRGPTEGEPRNSLSCLLAPGASLQQAEAALTAAAARLTRSSEETVAQVQLTARSGFIAAGNELKPVAVLVFAAFLTVLAIACANLANLCLSRAASRTHEIGMRLSLGASRARIVRQLLTESTFIALLAAALGVVLGILGVQYAQQHLATFAGDMGIAMLPIQADWRALLFCAALGIMAGLAFGLMPAIEVTSPSLTASTNRESAAFGGRIRPRRMRNLLIVAQVASSLVLLIVAGILIRYIQRLNVTSTGYDLDRIFDLRLDNPKPALLALLAEQPFIGGVTAVARVPLYGSLSQYPAAVDGRSVVLSGNHVDERFFHTLGLPVEGRSFTAREAATNAKVAIISRGTAHMLWPQASPLGRAVTITDENAASTYEVIGIVPDIVSGWLFRGKDPTAVYLPAAAGQEKIQSAMVWINGSTPVALAAIRKLCASGADATGCEPVSMRELSGYWRFLFTAAASVATALGALALVLTAVGLYSVISYSVVQRRREIGVHLACGASSAHVVRRVLGEAWRCVLVGMLLGLPVCFVLSRLIGSLVFRIEAFDLAAYAAVPALLALIATLACAVPARRAARMDPMASLREE